MLGAKKSVRKQKTHTRKGASRTNTFLPVLAWAPPEKYRPFSHAPAPNVRRRGTAASARHTRPREKDKAQDIYHFDGPAVRSRRERHVQRECLRRGAHCSWDHPSVGYGDLKNGSGSVRGAGAGRGCPCSGLSARPLGRTKDSRPRVAAATKARCVKRPHLHFDVVWSLCTKRPR